LTEPCWQKGLLKNGVVVRRGRGGHSLGGTEVPGLKLVEGTQRGNLDNGYIWSWKMMGKTEGLRR